MQTKGGGDIVSGTLAEISAEGQVIPCLRLAGRLAAEARDDNSTDVRSRLQHATREPDPLLAIASIHALAETDGETADETLAELLDADQAWRRQHAAWALASRPPSDDAARSLVAMVEGGGFGAMLAQATLERWALHPEGAMTQWVASGLARRSDPPSRRRLVETLGLDPRPAALRLVESVACDENEDDVVRVAAIAALGDQPHSDARSTLVDLAGRAEGDLATHALLALHDASQSASTRPSSAQGLRIAQLFLHADLDSALSRAGVGDTGGIASLLVLLGRAIADLPKVSRVLTISRGSAIDALADALWPRPDTGSFGAVPFPTTAMRDAWEHRVAAERGIRRQLRAQGPFDVVHLRMADVGTLAAARVAVELGVAVIFTAAPDPHGALDELGAISGRDRELLGDADAERHWWFRARLVERLARTADGVALMPRPNVLRDIPALLSVDADDLARRSSVIPEGVHRATLARARRDVMGLARGGSVTVVLELQRRLASLGRSRRDLPLLVTAGRFASVKGVDRVAAAWAGAPDLRDDFNLLVIGGDLDAPSLEERETLGAVHAAVDAHGSRAGLVLFGHRPHLDTARLLAYAYCGGGIYICGSAKEEFGLAIVEALGAGLVAVAPEVGGPATYLRDGETGVLVDGTSTEAIREGIRSARALVSAPGRASAARAEVNTNMTIERMAVRLVELYERSASRGAHTQGDAVAGVHPA